MPALPTGPATSYDSDGDGLIEVTSLEQLDALRYDLDGNGRADFSSDAQAYAAAFPEVAAAEGCEGCAGYELARSLDFQDADNYASGAVNPAWISGDGWPPIAPHFVYGSPPDTSSGYKAVFDGSGHTISNLYARRILTEADRARLGADDRKAVGLFGVVDKAGILRRVGMIDVDVEVKNYEISGGLVGLNAGRIYDSYVTGSVAAVYGAGVLTGENHGTIQASYTKGKVSGKAMVGGLSGYSAGAVTASYAKVEVSGRSEVGGLVGYNHGEIMTSYAAGRTSASEERAGGLVGASLGTAVASYWDTQVSGEGSPVSSGYTLGISGFTTSELQRPTQAAGIYVLWGADIDNADGDYNLDTGREDYWDFGDSAQYAALKADFDGDGVATWWEFGDQDRDVPSPPPSVSAEPSPAPASTAPLPTLVYPEGLDSDGDGLIEICNLEQLYAIRYDLDGDGIVDENSAASAPVYEAAFPTVSPTGLCDGACQGYELGRALDFREGGDYASGVVNESWTAGSGWLPIGSGGMGFNTAFDGNGYAISGLYINRLTVLDSPEGVGLFGVTGGSSSIRNTTLAEVQAVGLAKIGGLVGVNNGLIIDSHVGGHIGFVDGTGGGLVGLNHGEVAASSSHVSVSGGGHAAGGLVGRSDGKVRASYAAGRVSGGGHVGGLIGSNGGEVSAAYATGGVYAGWDVGGLIGSNGGEVSAVYATGNVCGSQSIGGLVGWNSQNSAISNSYATGSVIGLDMAGGLVGYNSGVMSGSYDPPGKVVSSYSIGAVSGRDFLGGLIGENGGEVVIGLWDSETSKQAKATGRGDADGAQGATTAELQSHTAGEGIFAKWGDDLWDFGNAGQYPALKADMDGDGVATWQEFGEQSRVVPEQGAEADLSGVQPGFFPSQSTPAWCD